MYEQRKQNPVYSGAMYEAAQAPQAVGNVRMATDVTHAALAKGQAAVAENMGAFSKVMLDRYEFQNKTRRAAELQRLDAEANLELDKRMALPNGDADGFFDEAGRLRDGELTRFLADHRRAVEGIKDGSVVPKNREEDALYTAKYLQKFQERTNAALHKAVSDRARRAFDETYNLYMETGDYGSAQALASEAFEAGVMSREAADAKAFEAQKQGVIRMAEDILVDGEEGAVYDLVQSGTLDPYMSPLQQQRLLEQGRKMYESRVLQGVAGRLNGLKETDVKAGEKMDPGIAGVFSERQLRLYQRQLGGENVVEEMLAAARDEARAVPVDGDIQAWVDAYRGRWMALGLKKEQLSEYVKEAETRRKELQTADVDVKYLEDTARQSGEIVPEARMAKVYEYLYDEKGDVRAENVKQIREIWGKSASINANDSDEVAVAKYERWKLNAIRNEVLLNVQQQFNKWRDSTEEGQKANPTAQARMYEKMLRDASGREVNVGSVQGLEDINAKQRVEQTRRYKEWAAREGNYYRVDTRWVPGIRGAGQLGVNTKNEGAKAGILMPEAYKGKVTPGKDGVTIRTAGGMYAEVPIVGFTDAAEPEVSAAMAKEQCLDGRNMPRWEWAVKRGPEHERLMGKQQAGGAGVRGSVSATTRLGGYEETRFTPQVKKHLGKGLEPLFDAFVQAGRENNIDPKFLMAIAINESGYGTSRAAREFNNVMGVFDGKTNTHKRFASKADSIRYMARQLKNNYFGKGLQSVQAIGKKYAPTGPGVTNDPKGLNKGWISGVTKMYNLLRGEKADKKAIAKN